MNLSVFSRFGFSLQRLVLAERDNVRVNGEGGDGASVLRELLRNKVSGASVFIQEQHEREPDHTLHDENVTHEAGC